MGFENNFTGAYDLGGIGGVITNNQFSTLDMTVAYDYPSVGLALFQSQGYVVERNSFKKGDVTEPVLPGIGVWFLGPAEMDNRIYDNTFHDLNIANLVWGDHAGILQQDLSFVYTGLQMLCNEYHRCYVDQYIMQDGYIRKNQGEQSDVHYTANNRFFKDATCTGADFEPWVDPFHPNDLEVEYYYFAGSFPELRPQCIEVTDGGDNDTWIGDYYDLHGVYDPFSTPFNPTTHCHASILDDGNGPGPVPGVISAYNAKLAEFQSAVEAYNGEVDNGDRETPLQAINASPAWPSHQLRDLLLLHSPLSDTVMCAAIGRTEPMDPWHLTQVLIANSRLPRTVWIKLDANNTLPPFFYDLLVANQSNPSYRALLEDEIALRSAEKDMLLKRLYQSLDADSSYTGRVDTLMAVYLADSLGSGLPLAYRLAVQQGLYAEAADIAASFAPGADVEALIAFGEWEEQLQGDWAAADSAQRAELWDLAFARDRQGSAGAWATLYMLGETDTLPTAHIPPAYRAAFGGRERARWHEEPRMAAYPNPAKDRVMITLPEGVDHGELQVFDAQGRLVHAVSLLQAKAFVELDARAWTEGLYLAKLTFEGYDAGECKFTVVR